MPIRDCSLEFTSEDLRLLIDRRLRTVVDAACEQAAHEAGMLIEMLGGTVFGDSEFRIDLADVVNLSRGEGSHAGPEHENPSD